MTKEIIELVMSYFMKGKKTMYTLRHIQFDEIQKKVQFFNNKKTGLILISLLDDVCRSRIV